MAAPYILAHKLGDAHKFAQEELGAKRGYYRVVTSPGSIKGPVGADLYLVPGWEQRYDRFSMKTALKFTRLNVIDVEEWRAARATTVVVTAVGDDVEPPQSHTDLVARVLPQDGPSERVLSPQDIADLEAVLPTAEPDGLEPAGEQLTIEGADVTPAPEPTPVDEAPPAEEPKRRRRRCKECGELVEPERIDEHAAEHLPEDV